MPDSPRRLSSHYAGDGLLARVLDALDSRSDPGVVPTIDDLAPLDEFHLCGAQATRELIDLIGVAADARVLDLGCGLGGPARRLARATGCSVVGIDSNWGFCRTATELTRRIGLTDRVEFHHGDAADLADIADIAGRPFDAAWMIHVGMNICDKANLFSQVATTLRPGGAFVVYDILSAGLGAPTYPTPWAGDPADSHLATCEEMHTHLKSAGFVVDSVHAQTAPAVEFLANRLERIRSGQLPPLGLHLIFGPRTESVFANLHRALERGLVIPTTIRARVADLDR